MTFGDAPIFLRFPQTTHRKIHNFKFSTVLIHETIHDQNTTLSSQISVKPLINRYQVLLVFETKTEGMKSVRRLFATDYEILHDIVVGGLAGKPMDRYPVRVSLLVDEKLFFNLGCELIGDKTIILDEVYYDWLWADGRFYYFSRHARGRVAIVVIYAEKYLESETKQVEFCVAE